MYSAIGTDRGSVPPPFSSFRLFGDSVNVAARMESNGLPGKIHVSRGFADALQASGRRNWLVARDDKVHAKGLGYVDTFWLKVVQTDSRTSGAHSSDDLDDVSGSSGQRKDHSPSSRGDNLWLSSSIDEYEQVVEI